MMNLRAFGALLCGMWLAFAGAIPEAAAQVRPFSGTKPVWPIDTLKELHDAFFACMRMPSPELSQPGVEITIRFAVTRDGEILGEPRFTFVTPDVSTEKKAAYQRSMAEALKICTPFPLTASFGSAVAGRPHALRVIDTRGQRKA
jgi:hypothetical protein